jgi:hypothetical protein
MGIFGGPHARVLTLTRRSKKRPAGPAVGCSAGGTTGYNPKLRQGYGHNLEGLVTDVVAEFKFHPLRSSVAAEFQALNSLYAKHRLRYGSFYDVLVDPVTISSDRVLRRMAAALRLAERHLARRPLR